MRPSRRTLTILLAVATVAIPVALAFSRGNDRPRSESAATGGGTPMSTAAGETVGQERSEAGATRAAVSYLELTEQVFGMTPAAAGELQRSISTSRSADRLGAVLELGLGQLQASVPDGIEVHVAPMMLRATAQGDAWDVSIWYVQVGIYGREIAAEQWETATYRMVWEEGQWRVDDMVSFPGPIPTKLEADVATPVDRLVEFLTGFESTAVVR